MNEDATEGPVEEAAGSAAMRPENRPEKFWDAESGSLRVDTLVASYRTLEQKLSSGGLAAAPATGPGETSSEADDAAVAPPDYKIETGHELFEPHSGVNEVLREAGFSQDQAQVVYDLAAQVLQPIVDELGAGRSAMADEARFEQQFGGTQKWTETRRQLQVWGQRHLQPDAYASLSSSYDGVLALHRLMQSGEPSVLRGGTIGEAADEGALRRMIRDPRYWRDRDPAILRKVSDGFKRLYPQE